MEYSAEDDPLAALELDELLEERAGRYRPTPS
jgi:hypothetical protein